MSMHAKQALDLKIGGAFSQLMTKAYLDMAEEKFRSVAEHRNLPGNERAQETRAGPQDWCGLQPADDQGLPGHGHGELQVSS
jgi:hypothetical protein